MSNTKPLPAALVAAAVWLCMPSLAAAAVTIGGDLAAPGYPTPCGASACEVAQISLATGHAGAPLDGVVVRWRVSGATGPLALRVLRSVASSPNYIFVSTSAPRTPSSTGVQTFATRQPINAGDYVGLEGQSIDARIGIAALGMTGDAVAAWSYVPDGHLAAPVAYGFGGTIAYNADVEPDADHDGYGDETQDACPGDARTQGACTPPTPAPASTPAAPAPVADTTPPILRASTRRAKLTKRGAISFVVTSGENATGQATGTIRLPRRAKAVRFLRRTVALVAGARAKITLRLARSDAALVRAKLANRARLKAGHHRVGDRRCRQHREDQALSYPHVPRGGWSPRLVR